MSASNSGYDKGFSGEAYSAFCSTVRCWGIFLSNYDAMDDAVVCRTGSPEYTGSCRNSWGCRMDHVDGSWCLPQVKVHTGIFYFDLSALNGARKME